MDRVAVVGPVGGDRDHRALSLGLDGDGLARGPVDVVHVEAQVRAVGHEYRVARGRRASARGGSPGRRGLGRSWPVSGET
jgi:hypothetical protein